MYSMIHQMGTVLAEISSWTALTYQSYRYQGSVLNQKYDLNHEDFKF